MIALISRTFAPSATSSKPLAAPQRWTKILMRFVIMLLTFHTLALTSQHALAADSAPILKRIANAEKSLNKAQQTISSERSKLAKTLRQLEAEVLALREKTAVARRLHDENTIGITELQERLSHWQQQQNYQRNLLVQFSQQHPLSHFGKQSPSTDAAQEKPNTAALMQHVISVEQHFYAQRFPQWLPESVILPNGDIQEMSTLTLGPSTWFVDTQKGIAGIATSRHQHYLKADALFKSPASQQLSALQNTHSGLLPVDPTINKALVSANQQDNLSQHLQKGGIWVIPILLFAVVSITVAIGKSIQLWRLPKLVSIASAQLSGLSEAGMKALAERLPAQSIQKQLLSICAATPNSSQAQRDDLLFVCLQNAKQRLEQYTGTIAVIASVAPLLGLLGTVSGMIETFRMMTLFGAGDPEVVSGGIAQALITTELGLVVAIPSLILSALLSRHAKNYYQALEQFALHISAQSPTEAPLAAQNTKSKATEPKTTEPKAQTPNSLEAQA